MAQARGHLGLTQRAASRDVAFGGVQMRRPDDFLDRDIPAEQLVAGAPDDSHPAPADNGLKPVTPGKKAFWLSGTHVRPITPSAPGANKRLPYTRRQRASQHE